VILFPTRLTDGLTHGMPTILFFFRTFVPTLPSAPDDPLPDDFFDEIAPPPK
jgi:hypothetical protein